MNALLSLLLACTSGTLPTERPDLHQESPPPSDSEPIDSERPPVDSEPPAPDSGDPPDDLEEPTLPEITFDPPGGTFFEPFQLTLSAREEGAEIYYSLEDSRFADKSWRRYEGPITLDSSATVKAVAYGEVGDSEVEMALYVQLASDMLDFLPTVPVLVFHSFERAPESKSETYTPFILTVFDPAKGHTDLLGEPDLAVRAGLKVRGSSSAGYPKHPYRLETWEVESDSDDGVELLGLPKEADWVLHAPLDFDRALIHNPLMYSLSAAVGRYAPRTRYAEVFVAGEGAAVSYGHYMGLYAVVENIEQGEDRVDVEALSPLDASEPEITGGYIFKRDRTGPGEGGFWAGSAGGAFTFYDPLVNVTPEEDEITPPQHAYLFGFVDDLALAIASPGFVHPETKLHYSEYIDVGSWIDHHILNVLAKNPDAFRLSGYFFKDREGPVAAGPVWDFDRTMGCSSDYRAEDPWNWDASNVTSDTTDIFEYGWYGGLFEDPAFREAYWARWRELIKGPLSLDSLRAEIDAQTAGLDEAAARNFERWPDYPPRGNGTWQAEVQILRDWLTKRHAWIEGCLEQEDPQLCGK